MFEKQKEKVKAQIKDLKRHLKKIDYKIGYYQIAKDAGTMNVRKNTDKECVKNEIARLERRIKTTVDVIISLDDYNNN